VAAKVPPHVDLVHEVEALHRRFGHSGQEDRAGVVHEDVDPAESPHRGIHGSLDLLLPPHVHDHGKGAAAGPLDLLGRRVNGSGELRMGLRCLGRDHDAGAVCRSSQGDGLSDAPAAARDEQGSSFETSHGDLREKVAFHSSLAATLLP
jgi:hypothetical protein